MNSDNEMNSTVYNALKESVVRALKIAGIAVFCLLMVYLYAVNFRLVNSVMIQAIMFITWLFSFGFDIFFSFLLLTIFAVASLAFTLFMNKAERMMTAEQYLKFSEEVYPARSCFLFLKLLVALSTFAAAMVEDIYGMYYYHNPFCFFAYVVSALCFIWSFFFLLTGASGQACKLEDFSF